MSNRKRKANGQEIFLGLQAPIIAMQTLLQGKYLPKVFAEAALSELKKLEEISKVMDTKTRE